MSKISLPQHAANKEERATVLAAKQADYPLFFEADTPPYVEDCPEREKDKEGDALLRTQHLGEAEFLAEVGFSKAAEMFKHLFFKPESPFDYYLDIFKVSPIDPPPVAERWKLDVDFARQTQSGLDPTQLTRVDALPPNMPITDALVAGVLPEGTTLASLIKEQRLYKLDYAFLTKFPQVAGKHCCDPIALFWVNERKTLMPLAIQLSQNPADGPIFTPTDPPGLWLAAKLHVKTTIAVWHAVCGHLYLCHRVMETTYIAMQRHLSDDHPVLSMLKEHFWFLIRINDVGRKTFSGANGVFSQLFGMEGHDWCLKEMYRTMDFSRYNIPEAIERKGVASKELLPDYLWRDDALKMWGVISKYVNSVVDIIYANEADIDADFELQAWIKEMATPHADGGCGFAKGLPVSADGKIHTKEQVKLLLNMILYNVGAGHATMNNSPHEYLLYIPNNPYYFTLPPPKSKDQDISDEELAKNLPSGINAIKSVMLPLSLTLQGSHGMFAEYRHIFPGRDDLQPLVAQFQADLKQLGDDIEARNANVFVGYTYLNPRKIAQSIVI